MKIINSILLLICTINLYSQKIDTDINVSKRSIKKDYTSDMDTLRGMFIITNLTDSVIKVLGTDRDCTCSNVKISSNVIQPKQTITLTMSVAIHDNSSIETNSVLLLSTKQKFYRFKLKGNKVSDDNFDRIDAR